MITKQDIIKALQETAKANGGVPLGRYRFEKESGIKPHEWGKYFARFGDAQIEAGFDPNTLQKAYDDEFIIKKMIGLIRKLGKFPTYGELPIAKNDDPEFPGPKTLFETKKQKRELAEKIIKWCKKENGYDDVIGFCASIIEEPIEEQKESGNESVTVGEVYLFKSGRYYKIGKTNDTVRRGNEIRVQLPERMDLIHSIRTDDPSGVEAYWHRRFESKRMQGEWFDLNSADIKAFKRWRKIV